MKDYTIITGRFVDIDPGNETAEYAGTVAGGHIRVSAYREQGKDPLKWIIVERVTVNAVPVEVQTRISGGMEAAIVEAAIRFGILCGIRFTQEGVE